MAMQKSATMVFLALGALAVVLLALVSAALVTTRTISSTGTIAAVGVAVFWDSACTNQTASINWGTLVPNSTGACTVYVKNNGTVPVTLNAGFGNWNPGSASGYMTPGWNCSGYALGSSSVVAATLTLTVSPNITGVTSFSFDVTITGTQ